MYGLGTSNYFIPQCSVVWYKPIHEVVLNYPVAGAAAVPLSATMRTLCILTSVAFSVFHLLSSIFLNLNLNLNLLP